MRRLLDLLAPLGILVWLAALGWQRSGRDLPGEMRWYLIAGAALVLAHLLLRAQEIGDAVGARQLRHGGNAVVFTLVVAGILGAVNWLAQRHDQRVDLTENQRHSLSDQTIKVVTGLGEDVRITYFGRFENLARGRQRLDQYAALSSRLEVRYVDPVSDPVTAQAYEARPPWPLLFVERGETRERLTNDSEQDVTNALIKVFREEQKTVCFLEGEGERDTEQHGELGFSEASAALESNQYLVRKVLLLRESGVPEDCSVVAVAGPQNDLLPPVVDALRRFVRQGGALLVMTEPPFERPQPNLDGLLREWDLEPGADVAIDVSGVGQLFGTGALTPIVIDYPYHEITKDMGGLMTAFNTARSLKAGAESIDGVVSQNLVETSGNAWAESDLALSEPIQLDEGSDQIGPVVLGALATVERAPGEAEPEPEGAAAAAEEEAETGTGAASDSEETEEAEETAPAERSGRVVAYGDVDFASNQFLPFQGNQDLFLNTIAWLAEDAELISIRPKEPGDQRLFLTQLDRQNLAVLALLLIPGAFVVGGISAWWHRR